ncbi:protein kinase-like domain-containing protein [Artemisia annua]|uniref:Protein kinase-like domain-containing protein n=1 Tax=Artemisia annua TaxID=35608 RepID=A0A2U1NJ86_ARTAN|nr:protein kinase-like domain-containing protein [Artemisia annua]
MVFPCKCFSSLEEEIKIGTIIDTPKNTNESFYTAFSNLSKEPSNLRVFTFAELRTATNNFRTAWKDIGVEDGFGRAFRGVIKSLEHPFDDIQVTIKSANGALQARAQRLVTDVNGLGLVEHPNLVKLVGYCVEDNERAIQRFLVYENMPNGSIEHHLYSRSGETLSWTMRLKVAQDTARALVYLHEEMDFQNIFKDFKSPNILLDGQWNAKLSDFGLARLGPQGGLNPCIDYEATWNGCLHGTREYVLIGNQSDTWNYGVFLYELITGKRPLDMKRPENEENLLEWVRPFIGSKRFQLIVDPRLEGNYSLKSAQKLSIIANKCLSKNPKSRPKMSEVLGMVNQLGFHHKQPVTHHFVWSQWLQLS